MWINPLFCLIESNYEEQLWFLAKPAFISRGLNQFEGGGDGPQ